MIKEKPRLLVCSVDSFPRMGGVSTLAYEVTHALKPMVSECVYLGPKGLHFGRRSVNFSIYEDWESDQSLRAGEGSDLEDERIIDLMKKIIKFYGLDGVVAFHPFYYGPAAAYVGKLLGLPTAVMVHGTELTSQFTGAIDGVSPAPMPTNSLGGRLVRTLDEAGRVVTNSLFTASIARAIAPGIKPTVIGCGIPKAALDHLVRQTPVYRAKLKARRRIRLGLNESPMIAYVGRLVPHKNVDLLIEMGAATGFQVVIMGQGPLRHELETLAGRLGAVVRFYDEADDEKKWQVLEAADFGFLMSGYDRKTGGFEGFGISMLEYCAAGAVCLTTGVHGMADFAEDGKTTINPQTDDGKLNSVRLADLIADEDAMDSIVQEARRKIKEDYTWDRVAENLLGALA
ncbi:glycosyltransferase family 4 protein [Sinorhizobium meliloti]|uniref:glycosyltransferase family 4 protein n=1 Tax=Rhizobium meliloti TaxID=382 RepID=UPI003D66201A